MTQTARPGSAAKPARGRNAGATRNDLLKAAMRRFTVLGYERTTMREVAADAGVNVSLINRYFGSKEGLFAVVMRESAVAFENQDIGDPGGLVESMLAKLSPAAWPEFGHEHPLLLLLGDVGGDKHVSDLRRRSLQVVVNKLADEIAGGSESAQQDFGSRAELVLSLIVGVLSVRTGLPEGSLAAADSDGLGLMLARIIACIRELGS